MPFLIIEADPEGHIFASGRRSSVLNTLRPKILDGSSVLVVTNSTGTTVQCTLKSRVGW